MSRASAASSIDKLVGRRLREARLAAGLTQFELAERAGLTRNQINHYECGNSVVPAGQLFLLASALQLGVEDVFAGLPRHCQGQAWDGRRRRALLNLFRVLSAIENRDHLAALAQTARILAAADIDEAEVNSSRGELRN